MSAYTNPFGIHRAGSGSYAEFPLSRSDLLFAFPRKGYLAKKHTDTHAVSGY